LTKNQKTNPCVQKIRKPILVFRKSENQSLCPENQKTNPCVQKIRKPILVFRKNICSLNPILVYEEKSELPSNDPFTPIKKEGKIEERN
jgi:hypothetical protein